MTNVQNAGPSRLGRRLRTMALLAVAATAACGGGLPDLPEPRPIINHQGARLRLDYERAKQINEWVTREQTNITEDPSFWVIDNLTTEAVYPWEGLRMSNDTVWVQIDARAVDARLVHQIYGHLHLMVRMDRQAEWLPEAPAATGYELERAILKRVADAWLLGRTTFDTAPYEPLDELVYSNEAGYLEPFIFTARPDEFAEARAEWARANPALAEEYRDWFLTTFNREPPGLRPAG
ncbi:MAG: hypothetical protein RJQ04_11315 [Longimicrobiales bacterium]